MDADNLPVVINIQLVLSTDEPSLHRPIHESISLQANSLIKDFLFKLQTVYNNQSEETSSSDPGKKMNARSPLFNLTCREKEVIELLGKGKSHKQIAAELHIACSTVGKHLQNIYEKLGVNSKYEVFQQLAQQKQLC